MSIIFTLVYSINEEKELCSYSPNIGEFKDPSIRIARKIELGKRGTFSTKDEYIIYNKVKWKLFSLHKFK
jgi:hypothetical protein